MCYLLGFVLMFCFLVVYVDVFKCVILVGEMVFVDMVCDNGEQFEKVRFSELVFDLELVCWELER